MEAMTDRDLIGSAIAAKVLGVGRTTFYRLVRNGRLVPAAELPGITGARLFDRADVDALAAERSKAGAR